MKPKSDLSSTASAWALFTATIHEMDEQDDDEGEREGRPNENNANTIINFLIINYEINVQSDSDADVFFILSVLCGRHVS